MSDDKKTVYKIYGKDIYKWPFGLEQVSSYFYIAEDNSFVVGRVKLGDKSKWMYVDLNTWDPSDVIVGYWENKESWDYCYPKDVFPLEKDKNIFQASSEEYYSIAHDIVAGDYKPEYDDTNLSFTLAEINPAGASLIGKYPYAYGGYSESMLDTEECPTNELMKKAKEDAESGLTWDNYSNLKDVYFNIHSGSYGVLPTHVFVTTVGFYGPLRVSRINNSFAPCPFGVYLSDTQFGTYRSEALAKDDEDDNVEFNTSTYRIVSDSARIKLSSFKGISHDSSMYRKIRRAYRLLASRIACRMDTAYSYGFRPFCFPEYYCTKESIEQIFIVAKGFLTSEPERLRKGYFVETVPVINVNDLSECHTSGCKGPEKKDLSSYLSRFYEETSQNLDDDIGYDTKKWEQLLDSLIGILSDTNLYLFDNIYSAYNVGDASLIQGIYVGSRINDVSSTSFAPHYKSMLYQTLTSPVSAASERVSGAYHYCVTEHIAVGSLEHTKTGLPLCAGRGLNLSERTIKGVGRGETDYDMYTLYCTIPRVFLSGRFPNCKVFASVATGHNTTASNTLAAKTKIIEYNYDGRGILTGDDILSAHSYPELVDYASEQAKNRNGYVIPLAVYLVVQLPDYKDI